MTTLAQNASDSDSVIVVTPGSEQAKGFRFRIGDEILTFLGYDRDSTADVLSYLGGARTRWRVARGENGTTAAAHLSGATLYAVGAAFATSANLTAPSVFVTSEAGTPTLEAVLAEANDANGTTITGLPEPSADTEAATKKYVDDNAGGPGGTPTLADVLGEGNETGGTDILAGPSVSLGSTGAKLQLAVGSQEPAVGGDAILSGGAGAPGFAGGAGGIGGGWGEDGESALVAAAGITAYGGDGATSQPGRVEIFSDGTDGNPGQVLVRDASFTALWGSVVSTTSETPVGGGLTSPLVADTTAKKLYAWTGSDYVQIGDWA